MVKLYSIDYVVDGDGKRTAAVVPIATWRRLLSEMGLPDSGAEVDQASGKPKLNTKRKLAKKKAAKPKEEKAKAKIKPKKAAVALKKKTKK